MSQQPVWKLAAQLGDVHPIDYGGYFVFVDETGVYPPEAEYLDSPDDDNGEWRAYRFRLEPCTFIDGILSDNRFHPESPAWFATPESERASRPQDTTYLADLADFAGLPVETLAAMFTGSGFGIEVQAEAWRLVGLYHGFENLDSYPLVMTREEAEARYDSAPYVAEPVAA